MADSAARKFAQLSRLRHQLQKRNESLASQFDFKIYALFHFKDKRKQPAIFEIAEVVPVMTNDFKELVLKGVKEEKYSQQTSDEMFDKDIVQLHAPRWQSLRQDILSCATDMNFILWPRNDIDFIECVVFSRWKGDDKESYRLLEITFRIDHSQYEPQLREMLATKGKSGLIINSPSQTMFLFVNKQVLESKRQQCTIFQLCNLCLYIPQDKLTLWAPISCEDVLRTYMRN